MTDHAPYCAASLGYNYCTCGMPFVHIVEDPMSKAGPIMTLNATDRCDRCMAQAYVTVDSPEWASSLLFCSFHYSEHAAVFVSSGAVILDERSDEMKWREVGGR